MTEMFPADESSVSSADHGLKLWQRNPSFAGSEVLKAVPQLSDGSLSRLGAASGDQCPVPRR
jgi:hypothetical protein